MLNAVCIQKLWFLGFYGFVYSLSVCAILACYQRYYQEPMILYAATPVVHLVVEGGAGFTRLADKGSNFGF